MRSLFSISLLTIATAGVFAAPIEVRDEGAVFIRSNVLPRGYDEEASAYVFPKLDEAAVFVRSNVLPRGYDEEASAYVFPKRETA